MLLTNILYLLFSFVIANLHLVISKHRNLFLDNVLVDKSKIRYDFLVNHFSNTGMVLDGLCFEFSKTKNKNFIKGHTVVIGKKTRE